MTEGLAVLGSILTATASLIGSGAAVLRAESAHEKARQALRAVRDHVGDGDSGQEPGG